MPEQRRTPWVLAHTAAQETVATPRWSSDHMEIVKLLRELWRQRILVALALALAIIVGVVAAYRVTLYPAGVTSRQHHVGIASARVLVDTPSSQVVDLGLKQDANAGVLPARAVLLANLLTTSPLRDEIATRTGVAPDRLIALADTPLDSGSSVGTPLATGASVKVGDPRASVVKLHTDVSLPLITVNTEAPDAATAARLADGTVRVLTDYLASLVTSGNVPKDRQLVVKRLGAAHAATEQRGPSRIIAVTAAMMVFLLGCGCILLLSVLVREWRTAAALERGPHDKSASGPTTVAVEPDAEFAAHLAGRSARSSRLRR
jgi:hypothetical protein